MENLCDKCDHPTVENFATLTWEDELVGPLVLDHVHWSQCPTCGFREFPLSTANRIHESRVIRLDEILRSLPIKEFLTAGQTAGLLGVTKQAFSKNKRIARGFIFSVQFDGKTVYLRKSVELFKKCGDGRFRLIQPTVQAITNYNQTVNLSISLTPTAPLITIDEESAIKEA